MLTRSTAKRSTAKSVRPRESDVQRTCVHLEQAIRQSRRATMAKPPTESSGPSSSGQSDLSQSVREAAASTLNQARQAIDQYMREANRRYGAMESSVEAAQSGRREINRNAIDFAEKNVLLRSTVG